MSNDEFTNSGPTFAKPTKKSGGCLRFWWVGLLLLLIPIGSCIGLGVVAYNGLKAPVREAVKAVNADPGISAALGGPATDSVGMELKNYENNNGNGGATVDFNVTGPSDSAHVQGRMKLVAGKWSPEDLTITISDGTTFQLPREE